MPFFRERKTGPQKLNDPPKAGRAHESQSWGSRHGCRNAEPEPAQHGEELGLPLADTPSGAGCAPCRREALGCRNQDDPKQRKRTATEAGADEVTAQVLPQPWPDAGPRLLADGRLCRRLGRVSQGPRTDARADGSR